MVGAPFSGGGGSGSSSAAGLFLFFLILQLHRCPVWIVGKRWGDYAENLACARRILIEARWREMFLREMPRVQKRELGF